LLLKESMIPTNLYSSWQPMTDS